MAKATPEVRRVAYALTTCARYMKPFVKVQFRRTGAESFAVTGSKSPDFDRTRYSELPDRQGKDWRAQAERLIAAYDRETRCP